MLAGHLLTLLLALAMVWYGLMALLLAVKVSPSTVNSLSGYRTAFDWLSGLTPSDVGGATTRVIIAGAGVLAFLVFGFLAFKLLPRPYLARRELPLYSEPQGYVTIEPARGGAAGRGRRDQRRRGQRRTRPLFSRRSRGRCDCRSRT